MEEFNKLQIQPGNEKTMQFDFPERKKESDSYQPEIVLGSVPEMTSQSGTRSSGSPKRNHETLQRLLSI